LLTLIPCCLPCSLIGAIGCSFPGSFIQTLLFQFSFLGAGIWVGINNFLPGHRTFFSMIFYLLFISLNLCSTIQSSLYFGANVLACPCFPFSLICSGLYYCSLCCATTILIAYFGWILKMGLAIQRGEIKPGETGMRYSKYGKLGVLMDICEFTVVHGLIMSIWGWTLPTHCLMGSALIPTIIVCLPCFPLLCCISSACCCLSMPHLLFMHAVWSSYFCQGPILAAQQTCMPLHPWLRLPQLDRPT
jgi:hypothetical protein